MLKCSKNSATIHTHRFKHAVTVKKPAVKDRDSGLGLKYKAPVNVSVIV